MKRSGATCSFSSAEECCFTLPCSSCASGFGCCSVVATARSKVPWLPERHRTRLDRVVCIRGVRDFRYSLEVPRKPEGRESSGIMNENKAVLWKEKPYQAQSCPSVPSYYYLTDPDGHRF